ncbi:MAG TPA: adenosine deaminase [Bryobacteraceae bacterium]|jgi:adenosine deaminase|nr:adenosine deaminase [Bryobacteraceae bacterium]
MNATELPKVELHLHLDCSLSYRAVSQLAPGVTRDEYFRDYVAPSRCTNLADFLKRAPKGIALMQDRPSLTLVTEDLFHQLQADRIVYAEIRFAPLLHTERGLTSAQVVEIVNHAVDRMSSETGIEVRLILCTLRHFDEEQSLKTTRLVDTFRGSRVTALDLAGDEAGFPITAHIKAYEYAQHHNLFRTAHAGEALGPESVWETLRLLNPTRIGHGTRSIEDPALVQYLRQNRVHLELCPSSNVQIIPSIADLAHHPIDKLYRSDVSLNINTDTRMLTPTTLTREYEEVHRVFGWSREEFYRTNLMAVEAAFVDEATKARLRHRLALVYDDVPGSVESY